MRESSRFKVQSGKSSKFKVERKQEDGLWVHFNFVAFTTIRAKAP